jgi:hypothetical protein
MYTIYIDDDRPILYQGRPILFPRAELAPIALEKSDCGASAIGPAPTELWAVYDIADAIYTLNERGEEKESELLDLIIVILDFANCTNEKIPDNYRVDLCMIADHLTFDHCFSDFLQQHNLDRRRLTDALYWGIGMIIYKSKIIMN